MSPPNPATLTNLPHELLEQIIKPLDDDWIYALAKTCKTLHFFALPLFLSRKGIDLQQPDTVSMTILSDHRQGLNALQTSLLAGNLRNISICAQENYMHSNFLNIRILRKLIARMPWICTLRLYSSLLYLGLADVQRWNEELSSLLDEALREPGRNIYIYRGDGFLHMSAAAQELLDPKPHSWERDALGVWKTLPGAACHTLSLMFSKTKDQPEPDLFHHPSLSLFHIASPMFLRPPLFSWTISSLQASAASMTHLRFHELNTDVNSFTWHLLLPTLVFPSLHQFELTCVRQKLAISAGVAFSDIAVFLRRNPSIQILDLSGIIFPSQTPPQVRNSILPKLCTLEAHPKLIAWLLSRRKVLTLTSVTIRSESGEFDYGQFDEVLTALAPRGICLGLNFVSKDGVNEWMRKHVSNSLAPSIDNCITDLTWVVNLTIHLNRWLRVDPGGGSVAEVFPQFLALFSRLEQVHFREERWGVDVKGLKARFLKKIMVLCPRLKSVSFNGLPIDLKDFGL